MKKVEESEIDQALKRQDTLLSVDSSPTSVKYLTAMSARAHPWTITKDHRIGASPRQIDNYLREVAKHLSIDKKKTKHRFIPWKVQEREKRKINLVLSSEMEVGFADLREESDDEEESDTEELEDEVNE